MIRNREKKKPVSPEVDEEKPINPEMKERKPPGPEKVTEQPSNTEEETKQPFGVQEETEQPFGVEEETEQPSGSEEETEQPSGMEVAGGKSVSALPEVGEQGGSGSEESCFVWSKIRVVLHEGKYHQVKRMFEAVGHTVFYLKRIAMGSLVLDDTLAEGEYRRLTDEELRLLFTN